MTEEQIKQYKIRYKLDNDICQGKDKKGNPCNKKATQIAHRISKGKLNYKTYDKKIIDHNFNLVSTCSLNCNGQFNIGNKPGTSKKLVKLIETQGDKELMTREINKYLE